MVAHELVVVKAKSLLLSTLFQGLFYNRSREQMVGKGTQRAQPVSRASSSLFSARKNATTAQAIPAHQRAAMLKQTVCATRGTLVQTEARARRAPRRRTRR